MDSIILHLHLYWRWGRASTRQGEALIPCPFSALWIQEGRGAPRPQQSQVPVSRTPVQSSADGTLGACWAMAWRTLVSLERFLLIVLFLPGISQTTTKKTTERGKKKNLLKMNCVPLPSVSQAPWPAHRSQAELVSAGCYSLHSSMIILGSLHDWMVKAQGGKSGLSAFIPSSATKILFVLGWHI